MKEKNLMARGTDVLPVTLPALGEESGVKEKGEER